VLTGEPEFTGQNKPDSVIGVSSKAKCPNTMLLKYVDNPDTHLRSNWKVTAHVQATIVQPQP